MLALAIGTLLAVGALAFVLYPLVAGVGLTPFRAPLTEGCARRQGHRGHAWHACCAAQPAQ